jgi:hypothetical protein
VINHKANSHYPASSPTTFLHCWASNLGPCTCQARVVLHPQPKANLGVYQQIPTVYYDEAGLLSEVGFMGILNLHLSDEKAEFHKRLSSLLEFPQETCGEVTSLLKGPGSEHLLCAPLQGCGSC